jgi:hypothetical protein
MKNQFASTRRSWALAATRPYTQNALIALTLVEAFRSNPPPGSHHRLGQPTGHP